MYPHGSSTLIESIKPDWSESRALIISVVTHKSPTTNGNIHQHPILVTSKL